MAEEHSDRDESSVRLACKASMVRDPWRTRRDYHLFLLFHCDLLQSFTHLVPTGLIVAIAPVAYHGDPKLAQHRLHHG